MSDRTTGQAPEQVMKRHLNAIAAGTLDGEALARDIAQCGASADLREGSQAWQDKRTPVFVGR